MTWYLPLRERRGQWLTLSVAEGLAACRLTGKVVEVSATFVSLQNVTHRYLIPLRRVQFLAEPRDQTHVAMKALALAADMPEVTS